MYKNKKIIGLILARGGSKSIHYKNIYNCAGKPLLYYTIESALRSELIDRLIISTDDEKIAKVAKRFGVEVPFMRPVELAGDLTPDFPVIEHVLNELECRENYKPDVIVHLRPTTPLKSTRDIDSGIKLLIDTSRVHAVRSVCEPPHTPFKMYKLKKSGILEPLLRPEFPGVFKKTNNEPFNYPRHWLPKIYRHSGYVDVIWRDTILKKRSMSGTKILPLFFEAWRDVDIDSMKDMKYAETIIRYLRRKNKEHWEHDIEFDY